MTVYQDDDKQDSNIHNKNGKVSIIIPAFNAEKSLERCIESCLNQTYKNYEVIVVDDGSTDSSELIYNKYSQNKRISIIRQRNRGVACARNRGLKNCTGDWCIFLDSDDYLDEHALEHLTHKMAEGGGQLVVGSHTLNRGSRKVRSLTYEDAYLGKEQVHSNSDIDKYFSTPWGKLYDISIIKNNGIQFEEDMTIGEDHLFNLNYVRYVDTMAIISDNVYFYSLGGTLSAIKYHEHIDEMYLKLVKGYKDLPWKNMDYQEIAYGYYLAVVDHYLICLNFKDALRECLKAYELFAPEINRKIDVESVVTNRRHEIWLKIKTKKIIRKIRLIRNAAYKTVKGYK